MEHERILFSEKQKFNQWWLWLILLAALGAGIFASINMLLAGQLIGGLAVLLLGAILPTIMMASLTLRTRVYSDRIEVGFPPLFNRVIPLEKVNSARVRTYDAVGEYGGWGYRSGPEGTAFNAGGSQGLQLVLKNGKRILIGTEHPKQLGDVVRQLELFDLMTAEDKLDLHPLPEKELERLSNTNELL